MLSQTFWHERVGAGRNRPCLFLDRDGVVVEEVNYLHRREDVRLLPGVRTLLTRAKAHGFAIGLVTNQAGIARGYYDWSAFEIVLAEIVQQLGCGEDVFDFVAACGTHPDGVVAGLRVANHSWRKPMPGMLLAAAACLELDLASSIMVGDQVSDMQAADGAGVAHAFHVRTGHGASQRAAVAEHRLRSGGRLHLVEGLDDIAGRLGWDDEGGLMATETERRDARAMDAVILAGGRGTRLQAAVADVPKPMARVNGRPFLDYQLIQLARSPLVGTVVLALGHLAQKVVEHYEANPAPVPLAFVVEDTPLGTGGAVRHAMGALAQSLVLVMNGDSLFDLDVAALLAAHRRGGRDATIALLDVPDTSRYGNVDIDGDRVTAFREKTSVSAPGTINAGVYLFERRVLAAIPEGEAVSMEHVVLPGLVAEGQLTAAVFRSDFIDIGLPETYRAADAFTTKLFGTP